MSTTLIACPFFDKLPAEIRLKIYDLASTSDDHEDGVNLCKANPPSKNILLTCRKAYIEARASYKRAYRQYWTTTNFTLTAPDQLTGRGRKAACREIQTQLVPLPQQDLEHIEHLNIALKPSTPHLNTAHWTLLRTGGLWKRDITKVNGIKRTQYHSVKFVWGWSEWQSYLTKEAMMQDWRDITRDEIVPIRFQIESALSVY